MLRFIIGYMHPDDSNDRNALTFKVKTYNKYVCVGTVRFLCSFILNSHTVSSSYVYVYTGCSTGVLINP